MGTMQRIEFDLVVLGTGTAGATPIANCRAAGWSVAVVDDQPYGGTCALRGCDPKKVLVGAAEVVAWQRRMQGQGVTGEAAIDWPELMRFKRSFTDPVPSKKEDSLRKQGVITLHGEAHFVAEDRFLVGDRELRAKHVLIATGAGPRPLEIPGEEHVISSTEFLELDALPSRIIFVGAGYISLEFAHVAHRAGAHASILGRRSSPLPQFDAALVDRLVAHTRDLGIVVELGARVTSVQPLGPSGGFRVQFEREGKTTTVECDLVVHGAGRVPNTARLDVAAGSVRVDARGAVEVNEFLQSVTNPRVYAAGDVTLPPGKPPLTPVAAHEGEIVAANLLQGNVKRPDYRGIPSVVFTIPALASVGMTEDEARRQGLDVQVKSEDTAGWYSNRRVSESVGMYKTIIETGSDRVVGAHLFGTQAEEVINLFAMAVRLGITARQLKHMIYSYPTGGSDLSYML